MTSNNPIDNVGSPSQMLYGPQVPSDVKKIKTGYIPRALQNILHAGLRRFNVLVCHRRFGKTVFAINELIDRALNNPLRNPHYAYIAPTYKQAKKVAWQYIVDFTRFLPNVKVNKSELTVYIDRPGRRDPVTNEIDPDVIEITLLGADDPDSVRGIYLDGSIIDEYAQCHPTIWGQVIRPALADRKKIAADMGITHDCAGIPLEPWAIFIGTPKGQNHFYRRYQKAQKHEKYCDDYEENHDMEAEEAKWARIEEETGLIEGVPEVERVKLIAKWGLKRQADYKLWRKYIVGCNWKTALYKASETGVLDQDEIDEMKEDLSPDEVAQELECDFNAAVLGSYYGYLIVKIRDDDRIGKVPYNPKYPVDTYWDIGIGDKCTIWFRQRINASTYHYIDYYETNGKGIEHFAKMLDAKAKTLGTMTEVEGGESIKGRGYKFGRHIWPHDGAAKEFGTGVTRQETARQLGLIVEIQPRQAIDDRISATRIRLQVSWFDKELCEVGLECLYNYQKVWDDKLMMFKNTPKHDWASHGADSFGYSALDERPSHFPDWDGHWFNQQSQADNDYDEFAA